MKKLLPLLCILLIGCTVQTQKITNPNGKSKTYQTFKNIDTNNYYLELFDRNVTKNDNTKIIMAKKDNNYYYEINGTSKIAIIQKQGYKYTIDKEYKTYKKEENQTITNSAEGIIPNIKTLKNQTYETGKEKIYNQTLTYEKYQNNQNESTYYFKGNKLIYIKYKTYEKTLLYKFNNLKKTTDKLFEIKNYQEITY